MISQISAIKIRWTVLFCLSCTAQIIYGQGDLKHRIVKRERAFDLLRLERALHDAPPDIGRIGERSIRDLKMPNDVEAKCQEKCNEELKVGLDMVKAHTAFGSMGVPSVVDESDLQSFCAIDAAHDECLKGCGFEIQFNMRDYVCKTRYQEMVANLPCYNAAAPELKRRCGPSRCGPYNELQVSVLGFAQRCRTLMCDLACTHSVLMETCGWPTGMRAFRFLLDYTRTQVTNWMEETSVTTKRSVDQIIPKSCSRLFCERFDADNCVYVPSA
uniref:Uncharacterized protein n=1 Tax=Panagrolaimus sp. JU765 TaxID=591449 RepID=A0AC34Q1J2_9BILA